MKVRLLVILLSILAAGPAAAQEVRTYTVKSGDTLHHIARSYGTSVNALMRMNGLTGSLIRIGQVLRLSSRVAVLPAEILSAGSHHVALRAADQSIADAAAADRSDPAAIDHGSLAAIGHGATAAIDQGATAAVDHGSPAAVTQSPREIPEPDAADADSLTATFDDAAVGEAAKVDDRRRSEMVRVPDELASKIDTTMWIVRAGETLYSIARDLGTKAYILYTLNEGIHGVLEPGFSIVVPATAEEDSSERLQIYAVGTASVFPESERGRLMAGGSVYDPTEFVVAHPDLPFDSVLIVESPESGRAAFARVADRGPMEGPHLLAVSPAVASEIGIGTGGGVQIRIVE